MKYAFKRKPYKHQVRALKKLLSTGFGGALLMEPRTGKTKVAVDYASVLALAGKVQHVVVICPIAALSVWEQEIASNCPLPYILEVWDREGRQAAARPESSKNLHFILINDDAFSVSDKRSRGAGRLEIRNVLRSWQVDLCIVDESHRIKSPSAKRSRVIHTFRDFSRYRVIMTGTPVTKKKRVFDVYSQWKFLNPERFADVATNFQEFKNWVGVWTNRPGFPMWLRNRPHEVKILHKRIHKDAYEVALKDCRDIPPARNQVIRIDLNGSRRAYDDMYRTMMAKLDSGEMTEAEIKLVQVMRFAQITSGFAKTTQDTIVRLGDEKLSVLRSLLEDWMEAELHVVVAARFREDIRAIVEMAEKMHIPVWRYQGGMTRGEKDNAKDSFNAAPGAALLVVQPKAAGLAIDLSTAHTMVWFSLTNSLVDWSQCCDRINLSPNPRSYVYLLARDTIDETMYQALKEDKEVTDMIRRSPERLRGSHR